MFLGFLLSVIIIYADTTQAKCNGVKMQGVYYDREVLISNLDRPYFMEADYSSDDLYFCYGTDADRRPAKLNMKTKEFFDIPGITPGRTGAQTINQENREVFVGGAGADGIYRYDQKNNISTYIGDAKKVWKLSYIDGLFFTNYPEYKLHTMDKEGNVRIFEDLKHTTVVSFVIDENNVMFYNNATGLYMQTVGAEDSVLLYETSSIFTIRSLAFNAKKELYACLDDGIYLVKKYTRQLRKLLHIYGLGVTFDRNDNMIFTDWNTIYRFKPNGCVD